MNKKPKTPFNLMDMTSTLQEDEEEEDGQPKVVEGNNTLLNKPHMPIHKKLYRNAIAYPYQFLLVMCVLSAYFCFGAAIGKFSQPSQNFLGLQGKPGVSYM